VLHSLASPLNSDTRAIDGLPQWVWFDVELRHHILMTSYRARNGSVNGKFVQRRGCELVVERYHKPHLESLQYDMHRY